MKHLIILLVLLLSINTWATAQTIDDIMAGIVVKKGEKIILRLDNNNTLFYDISNAAKGGSSIDFVKYDDKSYFLIKRNSVNIYMVPVNPLNLAVNTDISTRIDLITSGEETAIATIVTGINKMQNPEVSNKISAKEFTAKMSAKQITTLKTKAAAQEETISNCRANFQDYIDRFKDIKAELEKDQKKEMASAFFKLKGLSFENKADTQTGLEDVDKSVEAINKHFDNLKQSIDDLETDVKKFSCNDKDLQYLYSQNSIETIANFRTALNNQLKRPPVLKAAYELVKAAYNKAAGSRYNMLPWLVSIGGPTVTPGKVTDFKVKINKTGYELSVDQEIQASKTETANTYTINIRKFDWFVPQVAAGVVYANIDYPKFGTATNAAGKTIVADGGSDKVTKFSVTTMVNFNMFIPNSSICPFVQVGVGANSDYPALFFGGGLKISNVLSISAGAASPWIKQLNKLKIDSEISGTADLEKDITREFKPFSKVYCGLQIKL